MLIINSYFIKLPIKIAPSVGILTVLPFHFFVFANSFTSTFSMIFIFRCAERSKSHHFHELILFWQTFNIPMVVFTVFFIIILLFFCFFFSRSWPGLFILRIWPRPLTFYVLLPLLLFGSTIRLGFDWSSFVHCLYSQIIISHETLLNLGLISS